MSLKLKKMLSILGLTKEGFWFPYYGDELLFRWPWNRKEKTKFKSLLYDFECASLVEYWKHVGAYEEAVAKKSNYDKKIQGFDYTDILYEWIKFKYRSGCYVILNDIQHSFRPESFWHKLPDNTHKAFYKDVCVLTCKDLTEVKRLCGDIEPGFAVATGWKNGDLVDFNEEEVDENY